MNATFEFEMPAEYPWTQGFDAAIDEEFFGTDAMREIGLHPCDADEIFLGNQRVCEMSVQVAEFNFPGGYSDLRAYVDEYESATQALFMNDRNEAFHV